MELFNLYLWIQIVYGFMGIVLMLILIFAVISLTLFFRRALKRAAMLVEQTEEKISSVADRLWFLKLFSGENDG